MAHQLDVGRCLLYTTLVQDPIVVLVLDPVVFPLSVPAIVSESIAGSMTKGERTAWKALASTSFSPEMSPSVDWVIRERAVWEERSCQWLSREVIEKGTV